MKNKQDNYKQLFLVGFLFYKDPDNRWLRYWYDVNRLYSNCFEPVKRFYQGFFILLGILYIFQGGTYLVGSKPANEWRYWAIASLNILGGLQIASTSAELGKIKKGKKFDD